MPRYDFKCANGHLREDVWVSMSRAAQKPAYILECDICGQPMDKQPCAPNFSVSGFNAKNGYSK